MSTKDKYRDPLGVERILTHAEQGHKERPITRDEYEAWLDNPVTKRMHEEAELFIRRSSNIVRTEQQHAQIEAWQQTINWQPEGLADES